MQFQEVSGSDYNSLSLQGTFFFKTMLNLLCFVVIFHCGLNSLSQIGIRLKKSDLLGFQSFLPAATIKNSAQTKQVKPEVVREENDLRP